jgi:TadE-like protein
MQRGQSTVEFGASALVLVLLLFGLIDLGRVFYFDVGLTGAVREGARQASWFVPADPIAGTPASNPNLYDTDGWTQDPCPYNVLGNPYGDQTVHQGIKQIVDCTLSKNHLPLSLLQNPTVTCPATADGNTNFNPPYADTDYPSTTNQPLLFICYSNLPGVDYLNAPPAGANYPTDVNVILLMSFGFASGLLDGLLGSSVHIVANTHMTVGGY